MLSNGLSGPHGTNELVGFAVVYLVANRRRECNAWGARRRARDGDKQIELRRDTSTFRDPSRSSLEGAEQILFVAAADRGESGRAILAYCG